MRCSEVMPSRQETICALTEQTDYIKSGQISQEELTYALNHFNNVAVSMIVLLQIHKPPRYNQKEFIEAIDQIVGE